MTKVKKTVLLDEKKIEKSENDAKAEYWDNVRKNEGNGYVKGTLFDKRPLDVTGRVKNRR